MKRALGHNMNNKLSVINNTLHSQQDASVNFIENQLVGFLESRFVRKVPEYFICYLSSQTGCNRGCTFCHLTATGQTSFKDSDLNDFMNQALQVLRHYKIQEKAKYIHYNFMARGEPLANKFLLNNADSILWELGSLASREGLAVKYNLSTILPKTFNKSLVDVFKVIHPTIYYSIYSTNDDFRKKWMPGAMPVIPAIKLLKEYQSYSKKSIKIHYAFIEGVNDSREDILAVLDAVSSLDIEFNLVRYNPASPDQGKESHEDVIKVNLELIQSKIHGKVQMIPRVGHDVQASCGMFVSQ